jgi:hypothetical protein
MNKRDFVAGGMAAAVAAPVLARDAADPAPHAPLRGLLTRTARLPDLAERAGADTFEAYVGERFAVVGGPGTGERLVVAAVERVARCAATEQFNVSFATARPVDASCAVDGVRLLAHGTGQRVALHLESASGGYTARFNLLV